VHGRHHHDDHDRTGDYDHDHSTGGDDIDDKFDHDQFKHDHFRGDHDHHRTGGNDINERYVNLNHVLNERHIDLAGYVFDVNGTEYVLVRVDDLDNLDRAAFHILIDNIDTAVANILDAARRLVDHHRSGDTAETPGDAVSES
jgi:hypothetical protein